MITFKGIMRKLLGTEIIVYSANTEIVYMQQPNIFEIINLDRIIDKRISRSLAEERMANGRLFGVFVGDNIVHQSWLRFDEMDISEVNQKIKLNVNEACIYDCYTAEEFRGKGYYPRMLEFLRAWLKQVGVDKVYIYVEADNKSSIRGIEKAGFTKERAIKTGLFGRAK